MPEDDTTTESDELRIIGGMLASETPQQRAQRLIEMLERGEVDRVRALTAANAARTARAFARELASLETD